MGLALAEEAARRGADVTLIAANVTLPLPAASHGRPVETTAELEAAVRERFPDADVLIMAAAPADFRPCEPADAKLSREGASGSTRRARADRRTSSPPSPPSAARTRP